MALTGAERQRRSRAHRAGDHALCDPKTCNPAAVTPAVTRDSVARPDRLGRRGRALWDLSSADGPLKPAEQVILEEACRLADRLERLDALLRGEDREWARLAPASLDGSVVRVVVDGLLSETRQQQVALKQLLAEFRAARGTAPAKPVRPVQADTSGGAGAPPGVADLTARIADRRAQAQG